MPTEIYEKQLKAYEEDPRSECRYGAECYQKNPNHHAKFKHPPNKQQKDPEAKPAEVPTGRKRTSSECEDESSDETSQPRAKLQRNDKLSAEEKEDDCSRSSSDDGEESNPKTANDTASSSFDSPSSSKDSAPKNDSAAVDSSETAKEETQQVEGKVDPEAKEDSTSDSSLSPHEQIIRALFLTKMPDDFYKFYDFCRACSPKDPSTACKLVGLKLVGPYDVLNGRITKDCENEPEKYLRHWRYYYDPPEFQTILKGDDKEGLHYGYWRDDIDDLPIFVAKNSANKNCSIHPVAPNIFAAVSQHISERAAKANPFEKGPMLKLSKRLREFAKANGVSLVDENSAMRMRKRNVVTWTFHGAGIVVPYDKRTQAGYRNLAATDTDLKKILKQIDEANLDEKRKGAMASLEEVVRWAVIAADEGDSGTCLELAHDLFSSGVERVQRMGLQMFVSSYKLLNRQKFANIAEAHAKDRKKGTDLDVL